MIPVWTERNKWISLHIPENSTVIDWGCGNKDTLRYIKSPKKYLGIDRHPCADIVIDLNNNLPIINDHYDIGLVLGVLEYLDNPNDFLKNIKKTADKFIILSLPNRKKPEWNNNFTVEQFQNLLIPIWNEVLFERHLGYIIGICK